MFDADPQSWVSLTNALIGAGARLDVPIDTSGLALVSNLVCGALVAAFHELSSLLQMTLWAV